MKKLNRKGFTLVELLAVIIILAIVVGITIPAITNIINDSKNNALGVAVDAAEKYLSDQYSFMQLAADDVQKDFSDWIAGKTASNGMYTATLSSATENDKKLIEAMGFNAEDVTTVEIKVYENGGACVVVQSIPTASQYYSTEFWKITTSNGTSTISAKADAENTSKGC